MRPFIEAIGKCTTAFVICYPNAGKPHYFKNNFVLIVPVLVGLLVLVLLFSFLSSCRALSPVYTLLSVLP